MRLSALLLASCQIAAAQTCSDTCATQDRDGTAQVANNGVCEEPRLGAPCEATHACACPEYSDATDCEALRPCSSGSKPPPPVPMLIPPPAPSPMPQSVHGDSGAGVGGGRTNAGEMPSVEVTRLSVTATPYQDLQCNDRATCDHLAPRPPESTEPLPEWLAGDEDLARRIDLADSTLGTECTDAIRTSASLAPAATAELISGECTSCHAIRQAQRAVGSGTWYPCFTEGDMEGIPELGIPGLVAQGVNPEFVKITCESDESYSVEHFSDTECTEANKVSNDDINAAIMAVVEGIVSIYFLSFFMYGMGDHADAAVSGIMGCTSTDFNSWSGVSSPQTHCATMVLASFDEVRLCFARHTRRVCAGLFLLYAPSTNRDNDCVAGMLTHPCGK
eukprot:COSAG02_NODE_854_length_16499_cov_76.082561_10_plen_391_part_00